MKIPVLTYRPMHMAGDDYHSNDLRALASDLCQITAAGFKILPLRTIVDAWLDNRGHELEGRIVALTSEDGADLDYFDLSVRAVGAQRSVFNILRDFAAANPGAQDALNVTSFVIASPQARSVLDTTCLEGKGWWGDDWWRDAARSGFMHIGNNSWDHNHETLPPSMRPAVRPTTFLTIDSLETADHEIRLAAEFLREHVPNPGTALFAFPYGGGNPYLTREYFPKRGEELGIRAAFTAHAGFLEPSTGRWEVPRFLCRRDWSSPSQLQRLLDIASDAKRPWVAARPPAAAHAPTRQTSKGSDTLREFGRFVATYVEPIPGWLHHEAALFTAHLAGAPRARGIPGPTLEIGVYHGKYLSVLYELSRADEMVVGVDFFSGSDGTKDVKVVLSNVAAACGEASRLKMIVADSRELTAEKLRAQTGERHFRFISIDGGHTREIVCRDLETSYPLLPPGGIIALDDVFNQGTPGVVEGVAEFFLRDKPKLAPFAHCYNKLFVTTPDFHARYLDEARAFLELATWLPTHEQTVKRLREHRASDFKPEMFGYEMLTFL